VLWTFLDVAGWSPPGFIFFAADFFMGLVPHHYRYTMRCCDGTPPATAPFYLATADCNSDTHCEFVLPRTPSVFVAYKPCASRTTLLPIFIPTISPHTRFCCIAPTVADVVYSHRSPPVPHATLPASVLLPTLRTATGGISPTPFLTASLPVTVVHFCNRDDALTTQGGGDNQFRIFQHSRQ